MTRQSREPSLTGFLPDRLSMGLNSRCFSFTWLATMLYVHTRHLEARMAEDPLEGEYVAAGYQVVDGEGVAQQVGI